MGLAGGDGGAGCCEPISAARSRLTTPAVLQVPNEPITAHHRLSGPCIEVRQVISDLAQRITYRAIHQVRNASMGFGRLATEGLVKALVEMDGGALGGWHESQNSAICDGVNSSARKHAFYSAPRSHALPLSSRCGDGRLLTAALTLRQHRNGIVSIRDVSRPERRRYAQAR